MTTRVTIGGGNADVIHERVEPDVGHVGGIKRNRNSPVEPRCGTSDTEIFELIVFQEAEDFVATIGGCDEIGFFSM